VHVVTDSNVSDGRIDVPGGGVCDELSQGSDHGTLDVLLDLASLDIHHGVGDGDCRDDGIAVLFFEVSESGVLHHDRSHSGAHRDDHITGHGVEAGVCNADRLEHGAGDGSLPEASSEAGSASIEGIQPTTTPEALASSTEARIGIGEDNRLGCAIRMLRSYVCRLRSRVDGLRDTIFRLGSRVDLFRSYIDFWCVASVPACIRRLGSMV